MPGAMWNIGKGGEKLRKDVIPNLKEHGKVSDWEAKTFLVWTCGNKTGYFWNLYKAKKRGVGSMWSPILQRGVLGLGPRDHTAAIL